MAVNRVLLLAVAAVAGLALAQASLPPCCANQVTKEAYSSCTCLEDDVWLRGHTLAPGQSRRYHWRLTNWALINVPDEERPDITFLVAPCLGDATLYVTPMQPPFPDSGTARWTSDNKAALNSVTTKLQYSEYLISVEAGGTRVANYSIVAIVDAAKPVAAGNSGTVQALPIQDDETILYEDDTMSMNVRFTTSGRADAEYRVYAAETGPGSGACQNDNSQVGECIVSTRCGMDSGGMIARTPWRTFPANQVQNVIVDGLKQNQPYMFNVAARSGEWDVAYTGAKGTPTYQRVTRAQDDDTILIVVLVAGGIFVLLMILILWARHRLQKAYHRQHYERTANRFHGL